jgi:hypothetical protein
MLTNALRIKMSYLMHEAEDAYLKVFGENPESLFMKLCSSHPTDSFVRSMRRYNLRFARVEAQLVWNPIGIYYIESVILPNGKEAQRTVKVSQYWQMKLSAGRGLRSVHRKINAFDRQSLFEILQDIKKEGICYSLNMK